MKTQKLISAAILLIVITSCIVIKTKKSDDGSTTLTAQDSLSIIAFNDSLALQTIHYSQSGEIKFQVINAENLRKLIILKPYNWIFIGSSWCGISKFARMKYCRSITHFDPDSIQMIIIDQDFDLAELQKQIYESGFRYMTYLLDPVKYGNEEKYKQDRFIQDARIDLPLALFKYGGVPKSIVVDNNMRVLYYASGPDINSDTIARYTGLKKVK